MNAEEKAATTVEELISLAKDPGVQRIIIHDDLSDVPTIRLAPGKALRGEGERAGLALVKGTDGIQLSSDNQIANLRRRASPDKRAIFNDTSVASLGRIELRGVSTTGRVQILARDEVKSGFVEVDGLEIAAADAREERERPLGYGVDVLQGAFTLWNL